jgi:hypothetical protein
VQIAAPDSGVATSLNPSPAELSPEFVQAAQSNLPGTMNRGTASRAALKAGVLGVFIGMIPFLGIVLTGALAVYFYRREAKLVLPAALASRLGGAAGIVASAINALLLTIWIFVFHAQQNYIDSLTRFAISAGFNAADPDFQAGLHKALTPAGFAITFFFGLIFALVLASVGGALASWWLRPPNPRA